MVVRRRVAGHRWVIVRSWGVDLMRMRTIVRALCVPLCLLFGLAVAAPVSAATMSSSLDVARLAEAGIDASQLAPGWSIVGNEVWW